MIIIKSQDGKSIRNYGSINLNYQTQTEIIGIPTSPIILVNSEELESNEAHYVLGNYKTVERAIEVMKEIENFICELYADKVIMSHMSIEFSPPAYELLDRLVKLSKENAIYTMPKE